MKKKEMSLQEQAKKILEEAKENGLQQNFYFATTFKRYMTQIRILESLEKEIDDLGATVEKEYVKGRTNVYTNPAITEYNKTATAANGTVVTLMNILKNLPKKEEDTSLQDFVDSL